MSDDLKTCPEDPTVAVPEDRTDRLCRLIRATVLLKKELDNWACYLDNTNEAQGLEQQLLEDSSRKLRSVLKNTERLAGRSAAGTWGEPTEDDE